MIEHKQVCWLMSEQLGNPETGTRVCTCGAEEPPPTKTERSHAAGLLDDLTFGGHSFDGAVSQLAIDRRRAEESAVFDFLNWLAPQNIELHTLIPGGCSEAAEGELWERWKAERHD